MINVESSDYRLFDIADSLIDEKVGIIQEVHEVPRETGTPDFFFFYATACNANAFTPQKNYRHTGGASAQRSHAMAKAIGEAVERYCSAIYKKDEYPLVSFESASFQCVPPTNFSPYGQEQFAEPTFPFVEFTEGTPVRWVEAFDPVTNEAWHVPAAAVFMPYYFDTEKGEKPIGQRISTGLACHCSREEASIAAICEVIERDAFTITWQARLGRQPIKLDTLSIANQELIDRFERIGARVTLLDLTMDHGVPTILAVGRHSEPEAPALVCAASTSLDPEVAVRKSLEELAHTWRLACQLKRQKEPIVAGRDFQKVSTQDDHVHLFCEQANSPLSDFLFTSCHQVNFHEIGNLASGDPYHDLNVLISKVNSVNHQVLLVDLTTSDVKELGLSVIRAVIPGFHPLFIGHRLRAKGGIRLWSVPQKLGYPAIDPKIGDNPIPHPFP